MQVQIKFTAHGCIAVTGNFAPGDLLRTSADVARHLVKEAKCAEYVGDIKKPKTAAKRASLKSINTGDLGKPAP